MTDETTKGMEMTRDPRTETRSDINLEHNDLRKKIAARVENFWNGVSYVEIPPIPKELLVEVANICNHACVFCAYSKMTRPKGVLDFELFKRLIQEAFDLGTREIGLYSGAEPLTVKRLAEYIAAAKEIGYTYIYVTTNGALATKERLKAIVDAGLDSLKFSINGGDRDVYRLVHGSDDFDKVVANLMYVSDYRKKIGRQMYLSASFVECKENRGSYEKLKALIGPYVDEIFFTIAYNQAGQMDMQPPHVFKNACAVPFSRLTITQEGYLRGCCNDYQNFLAAADLKKVSLKIAWEGQIMRDLRRRHLDGKVQGTLCYNCMNGTRDPIGPINTELSQLPQI